MRGWKIALMAALLTTGMTTPVAAAGPPPGFGDHGGKGDDHGEADRPHDPEPESAKPDYPDATFAPANKANYTESDRPESEEIDEVVIHTMQGSYEGTKSWFENKDSEVSAHYIVRSEDGEITQMVHESDIGWHAGNWEVNEHSIGVEHEGYIDKPDKWYTDAMYESSARLVGSICERYGIPADRKHIIGHVEVPGADHTDPGPGWDWDKYMGLVKESMSASEEPPGDAPVANPGGSPVLPDEPSADMFGAATVSNGASDFSGTP